jgi:hypothetical protein
MEKKPLIDQKVNNFELIVTMKTMQEPMTAEKQSDFINQMFRAKLLCPVFFDPEPEVAENGETELAQGTRMMLCSITNPEKKPFLIAFTDKKEADRNKRSPKQHTITVGYLDYCNFIFQPNSQFAGFVINPFSENIILTREMMADINKNIRIAPPKKDN